MLFLGAAILAVALLSTGVMNPFGPRAWKVVTTLIPPYGMIRQPHKVYCLMPVLLALASGILLPALLKGVPRRWKTVAMVVLVIPVILDYGHRIKPTVCLLDRDQNAFRAIADDAKAVGNPRPHLLSLPVGPGDSHYDSLTEYYISLYRLRMVNGYGGAVQESYRTNIFNRLESLNVGSISDQQLDFLLKRGVGYLVLHEDCFPEKVSPFPVRQTLEALLNHGRLKFIWREGAMWSFKILPFGEIREKVSFMKYHFPARHFEFEDRIPLTSILSTKGRGSVIPSALEGAGKGEGYSRDRSARFHSLENRIAIPPSLASRAISLCWMVRARGQGVVSVANVIGGVTNAPVDLDVAAQDWIWERIEIPQGSGADGVGAIFSWKQGVVDLDSAILAEGSWASPAPGASVELPAACFFHAGHTDRSGEWVTLRAAYEPHSIVFYGPKLPLDKGVYAAEFVFQSDAPAGTVLGQFNIRWAGDETNGWSKVIAGKPAVLTFDQKDNRPFFAAFDFFRAADVRIKSVRLTRQPEPGL